MYEKKWYKKEMGLIPERLISANQSKKNEIVFTFPQSNFV